MTAYDDLTDSSPESPADALADQPTGAAQTPGEIGGDDQTVDPSGDPGGDTDLGTTQDDMSGQGPGVDRSDADRGNLDGSTRSSPPARTRSTARTRPCATRPGPGPRRPTGPATPIPATRARTTA